MLVSGLERNCHKTPYIYLTLESWPFLPYHSHNLPLSLPPFCSFFFFPVAQTFISSTLTQKHSIFTHRYTYDTHINEVSLSTHYCCLELGNKFCSSQFLAGKYSLKLMSYVYLFNEPWTNFLNCASF